MVSDLGNLIYGTTFQCDEEQKKATDLGEGRKGDEFVLGHVVLWVHMDHPNRKV